MGQRAAMAPAGFSTAGVRPAMGMGQFPQQQPLQGQQQRMPQSTSSPGFNLLS